MKESSSFRDPSGFLFYANNRLYRQVNKSYKKEFDLLIKSGLYDSLTKIGMMLPFTEVDIKGPDPRNLYKIIAPVKVPFISYPFEWSFHALKDAAISTLRICKRALDHGMILKDASAYNMQLVNGRFCLIDSLSFDIYHDGQPWVAYRQFCQHFLAPLALMAYSDIRLQQLLRVYIDGIPLDLAVQLLPYRARFNFGLLSHLFAHSGVQQRFSGRSTKNLTSRNVMTKFSLYALIDSLEKCIRQLNWDSHPTEWSNYYDITNYSEKATVSKKRIIESHIIKIKPTLVLDLGANNGFYSRIASSKGICTIALDYDPGAIDQCYLQVKSQKDPNLIPLIMDLSNPSSDIGWANVERKSLGARSPADLIIALALIHHLAITNNVPLETIADYFSELGKWLIIEFVPKNDSQVQKLLASRADIFDNYTKKSFEHAFRQHFSLLDQKQVEDSERTIYLFKKRK